MDREPGQSNPPTAVLAQDRRDHERRMPDGAKRLRVEAGTGRERRQRSQRQFRVEVRCHHEGAQVVDNRWWRHALPFTGEQ